MYQQTETISVFSPPTITVAEDYDFELFPTSSYALGDLLNHVFGFTQNISSLCHTVIENDSPHLTLQRVEHTLKYFDALADTLNLEDVKHPLALPFSIVLFNLMENLAQNQVTAPSDQYLHHELATNITPNVVMYPLGQAVVWLEPNQPDTLLRVAQPVLPCIATQPVNLIQGRVESVTSYYVSYDPLWANIGGRSATPHSVASAYANQLTYNSNAIGMARSAHHELSRANQDALTIISIASFLVAGAISAAHNHQ